MTSPIYLAVMLIIFSSDKLQAIPKENTAPIDEPMMLLMLGFGP